LDVRWPHWSSSAGDTERQLLADAVKKLDSDSTRKNSPSQIALYSILASREGKKTSQIEIGARFYTASAECGRAATRHHAYR
jgi:hypothetical protein